MFRTMIVWGLMMVVPASASAGPLREAAARAGREIGSAQQASTERGRGRFWTGIALIAGGGALAVFGAVEMREDDGTDDGDGDDVPGAKDSSAGEKAMLGGGIAAAALGGVLLVTGRKGPAVSMRHGRLAVTHTVRF